MDIKNLVSKKALIIFSSILFLYTIVGFFLVPGLLKNVLQDKLGQALNRQVEIQKVEINPYVFSAALNGVSIKGKKNDVFFSADRLYGNLSITSLFTFTLVVDDIMLDAPYVNITRNSDNTFNFSDLLKDDKTDAQASVQKVTGEKGDDKKEIFKFVLKKAGVNQAKIEFQDKVSGTSHLLEALNVSIGLLTSKREKRYEQSNLDISAILNRTPVNIHVASTPFAEDLATQIKIITKDIDILHYISYLPLPETLKLNDLDLNCNVKADFRKNDNDISLVVDGIANVLNIDLKNRQDQDLLTLPSIVMNIAPSDVLNNKLNIANIFLSSPKLYLDRDEERVLNLLKHIKKSGQSDAKIETKPNSESEQDAEPVQNAESEPVEPLEKKGFELSLEKFEVKNSEILFKDNSNKSPFKTILSPLNLLVTKVLVKEDVKGEFAMDFSTGQNEKLTTNGSFGLFPLSLKGELDLSALEFKYYTPYFDDFVDFIIKNGNLDLSCDFDLKQTGEIVEGVINNKALLVKDFLVNEKNLDTKISGRQIISLPEFKINNSKIDLGTKKVSTGEIASAKGKILLERLKDGQISLVKGVHLENSTPLSDKVEKKSLDKDSSTEWAVDINSVDIEKYNILINDLFNNDPVKIDITNMGIHADNLSTAGSKKGNVAVEMNLNKGGRLNIEGKMDLGALKSDLNINLSKIDVKPFQPYFTDTVKILVTKGHINTKGKLGLQLREKKDQIKFRGSSSLTDFISLDKKHAKDFFKCNSLYISGLSFSSTPVEVKVKDISLTDFYSRVIVNDNGEINLATIFDKDSNDSQKGEPEQKKTIAQAEAPKIDITNVTLQGGNIDFSDYLTSPNFSAGMKQISGSIIGLSSKQETRAKVHLQGLYAQSSPLDIMGEINPLAQKKYVDIAISYKDIELSDFTPYSSKFLGYKIAKGKLILDLEYTIDGNSLKSENKARFDNFTLGESVDSEHATSLPVSLAISLLKDGDGQINLDLPVRGELDDPEFSIAGIIFKMIGNLVLKVATSPFSIIGAMFGGGEDLGYVEFDFGDSVIESSNFDKLDTLIEILEKKPEINLEIQGMYHPTQDADSLREKGFLDLLKAEKLQGMIKERSGQETLDKVVLKDEERELYINQAYDRAQFPKPRDEDGDEKKIEISEKTKLLMTNVMVGSDDLRLLAMNRSKTIKAYIISSERVGAQRVFLLEPKILDESEQSSEKSKVQFSLK